MVSVSASDFFCYNVMAFAWLRSTAQIFYRLRYLYHFQHAEVRDHCRFYWRLWRNIIQLVSSLHMSYIPNVECPTILFESAIQNWWYSRPVNRSDIHHIKCLENEEWITHHSISIDDRWAKSVMNDGKSHRSWKRTVEMFYNTIHRRWYLTVGLEFEMMRCTRV